MLNGVKKMASLRKPLKSCFHIGLRWDGAKIVASLHLVCLSVRACFQKLYI